MNEREEGRHSLCQSNKGKSNCASACFSCCVCVVPFPFTSRHGNGVDLHLKEKATWLSCHVNDVRVLSSLNCDPTCHQFFFHSFLPTHTK